MYSKPSLVRFGSFRELTLIGLTGEGDGGISFLGQTISDATNGDWWCPDGCRS